MQLYQFLTLFSVLHGITSQRFTGWVAVSWSLSTGNAEQVLQPQHSCTSCPCLLYLYCVVTASQTNCMFTNHAPSIKQQGPNWKCIQFILKIESIPCHRHHSKSRQIRLLRVPFVFCTRSHCICQGCYTLAIQLALIWVW